MSHGRSATAGRLRVAGLCLVLAWLLATPRVDAGGGGNVLPPNAQPRGSSLAQLAQQVILFTLSGNQAAYYPQTRFQILYATNNQDEEYDPDTGIVTATGGNTFTVKPGTMFYVPIQGVDNTPPSPGVFPTTVPQAVNYLFNPNQYGASFEIEVDGEVTPVGPGYTVISVPFPLPDAIVDHLKDLGTVVPYGFVYRDVAIGVFLTPLSAGQHTVIIRADIEGAFLPEYYGINALQTEFTYVVNVTPPGHAR